jgi:hypothetical protein
MGIEAVDQAASQAVQHGSWLTGAVWKLAGVVGGAGIAAALAAVIVMLMSKPRDNKEWAVAMISTIVSSLCGGAFLIRHYGLQVWMDDLFGTMGLLGIVFACGLPGWTLVRIVFNSLLASQNKTLPEVVQDVRGVIGGRATPATTDEPQEQL